MGPKISIGVVGMWRGGGGEVEGGGGVSGRRFGLPAGEDKRRGDDIISYAWRPPDGDRRILSIFHGRLRFQEKGASRHDGFVARRV